MKSAVSRTAVVATHRWRPPPPAIAPPAPLFSASPARRCSVSANGEEAIPTGSYGLNSALASKGVLVYDKVFYNLETSELQKHGSIAVEKLADIPLHVRGNVIHGASSISKAQFSKLLKQVTSHLSLVPKIFVQDGAISASTKCDAKVRVISDNPSAVSALANTLWELPDRAISHDSCPLTVYVSSSISPRAAEISGLPSQASCGYAVADVERSSLVLGGKAFCDMTVIKNALAALAAPVISSRGGLPIPSRILASGDSVIIFFAPESMIESSSELCKALVSRDAGVVLSSHGVAPFYWTRKWTKSEMLYMPTSVILIVADSTAVFPSISKLSPGQAAYHFLAGYQNGKFVPTYSTAPSPIDPLSLAKAFFIQLKENEIPTFLINVNADGKQMDGDELIKLVEMTLSKKLPERKLEAIGSKGVGDLKGKYNSFLSGKFQKLPREFSF